MTWQSLLIQLGVKECIIQSDDNRGDHDLSKLRTLVERCQVVVTERTPGRLTRSTLAVELIWQLISNPKASNLT